jgi:hypothetical protein
MMAGAIDYVIKPFEPLELGTRIRNFLDMMDSPSTNPPAVPPAPAEPPAPAVPPAPAAPPPAAELPPPMDSTGTMKL